MLYGARYGMLLVMDSLCFSWHGYRPAWWQQKLILHHFAAPMTQTRAWPSQALRDAQQRYPDRICYVSLSSTSSPWSGTHFFEEVKVLVGNHKGDPPSSPGNGFGMPLHRFEKLQDQARQKVGNRPPHVTY